MTLIIRTLEEKELVMKFYIVANKKKSRVTINALDYFRFLADWFY